MKVTIVAFKGTGFRHPKYKNESALIRAGHVGFIFKDEPDKIYGFHPNARAVVEAGGVEALINLLKDHQRQPGTVQDDTSIFYRAHELANQDTPTRVYQLTYDLPEEVYDKAYARTQYLHRSQKELWYNFPELDGSFAPDEFNCAVFPEHIGLPIPSTTGMVSEYIADMKKQGATLWKPPE